MQTLAARRAGAETRKKKLLRGGIITAAFTVAFTGSMITPLRDQIPGNNSFENILLAALTLLTLLTGIVVAVGVEGIIEQNRDQKQQAEDAEEIRKQTGITIAATQIPLTAGMHVGYGIQNGQKVPIEYGYPDEHTHLQVHELTRTR